MGLGLVGEVHLFDVTSLACKLSIRPENIASFSDFTVINSNHNLCNGNESCVMILTEGKLVTYSLQEL